MGFLFSHLAAYVVFIVSHFGSRWEELINTNSFVLPQPSAQCLLYILNLCLLMVPVNSSLPSQLPPTTQSHPGPDRLQKLPSSLSFPSALFLRILLSLVACAQWAVTVRKAPTKRQALNRMFSHSPASLMRRLWGICSINHWTKMDTGLPGHTAVR